jgi:site-specific recombinase XerD
MTIQQAREIFIISRKARNLSKNTIVWYGYTLDRLLAFCEKNNIQHIEEVKSYIVESFLSGLKGTMRDVSFKDTYTIIRIFFTYLFDEEYIDRNPMKNMRQPKVEKKIMRTFNKQEIEAILKHFNQSDFFGLRNYLIMCLLFSTGMRKSEMLNLKLQDINITVDFIKVMGKGSKERYVPIGRTLRRILLQYMNRRTEYLKDTYCEYLIVSQKKTQLTVSGINILFKNLKTDLGWTGERISSHTWRHTFCKLFLLNGGDVFSLQRIVGHSDLRMTRKYVDLNDREIKIQHAKFNPLDNKDWSI